jgi:hypothetical protein
MDVAASNEVLKADELQDDLGGIVHLEHINLCIPEQVRQVCCCRSVYGAS